MIFRTLSRIVLLPLVLHLLGDQMAGVAEAQEVAKIAYLTDNHPIDIVVVNSDGTEAQYMEVSSYAPSRVALGPDAEWLAFQGFHLSEQGIFVMRVAAPGPGNLPIKVNDDFWGLTTMAWHPGGKHLAWVGSDDLFYPQICLGEVLDDTGAVTPVGPSNPKIALTQRGPNFYYCEDPAFSPDGKWLATVRGVNSIALLKIRNDAGEITPESLGNQSISVSNRIGDGLIPLWPSWSPNGRDLVFIQQRSPAGSHDEHALVTLRVLSEVGVPTPENAGNPRQVLIAPASHPTRYTVAFPSWSPDGTLIAFQSLTTVPSTRYQVATILTSAPEGPSNLRSIVVPGAGVWPTFPVNSSGFGTLEDPTWEDDITTAEPPMTGRNWRFEARNNSRPDFPNMTAWVQYSATPGDPGSWTDLGQMRTSGSLRFLLDTSNVPVGSFAFRIKTSVPGGGTTYSEASPIYDILEAAPILETELDVSSDSDPSGDTAHRGDVLTYTLRFRNTGGAPYEALKARIVYPRNTTTNFPAHIELGAFHFTLGGGKISNGEDFAWEWNIPSVRPVGQIPYGEARNTTKVVKKKGKNVTVYDKTLFSMPNDPAHGFENGDVLRLHQYFTTALPTGLQASRDYFVVNATAGQFQIAATAGGAPLLLTGIAKRVAPLHFERTNEWQTRTISFRLSDPTHAQEEAQANAGLPPINAEGAVITARARILTAALSEVDSVYSPPTEIANPLSLTIERVFETGPAAQGDLVTFNLIAKNNSSERVSQSSVTVSAPRGLALQGAGDFPVFLDEGGQPAGPPIDPATKRQVVRPASWKTNPELLEAQIPGPSPDSVPSFEQQARFYFGAFDPGVIRKMRFTCRVQYDWDTDSDPVISVEPNDVVFAGKSGSADRHRTLENEFALDILGAAPESGKPEINVWVTQNGMGVQSNDQSIATVANVQGIARIPQVPDSNPSRGINEIVYEATYANFGGAPANYVRLWMPIPENTELVRANLVRTITKFKTVKKKGKKKRVPYTVRIPYTVGTEQVNQAADDNGEILSPQVVGGGTWFTCLVPYLSSYPDPGWSKTVEVRVKLKPGVAVGTRIEQLSAFATSRELFYVQAPVFADDQFRALVAEVVTPAHLQYNFDQASVITTGAGGAPAGYSSVTERAIYSNTGGIAASGFGFRYVVPHGFVYKEARYFGTENSSGIIPPPQDDRKGGAVVIFNVGTVAPNSGGIAEVELEYDRNSFPDEDTDPTPGSRGGMTSSSFTPFDAANPLPSPSAEEEGGPQESAGFLDYQFQTRAVLPDTARPFVGVVGPTKVVAGEPVTYRIIVGNPSNSGVGGNGILYIPLPVGTTYVGSSTAIEDGGSVFLTDSVLPPNGGAPAQLGLHYPNGCIGQFVNLGPNSCVVIDFTIDVDPNTTGKLIFLGPGFGGEIANSRVTKSPISCAEIIADILPAGSPDDRLNQQAMFESQIGTAAAAVALGSSDQSQADFVEVRNAINPDSTSMTFGGTDLVTIAGNNITLISLGAGRLVAAGGGNLVGNDGASIIQASGGALVAAGGGNLVAAGGGNLISIDVPTRGRLTGQQFIGQLPQMVDAGVGNVFGGGGLNFVRHLVGTTSTSLIGMDGGTLIGLDGLKLADITLVEGNYLMKLPGGAQLSVAADLGRLVAAGGGNLVAAGGGNVVPTNGGGLVAAGAGNLVAAGGGHLLESIGLNLVPEATLVAAGGGNVVPTGGGGLVAAGGLNLVAAGGGNLVAAGGGNLVAAGGGNMVTISAGLVAPGGGN